MKRSAILSFALICSILFLNNGCASYFKKRSCNKVNWFEFGEAVALKGKWLNSNSELAECRKLEAEVNESELDKGFKYGVSQYCTVKYAESLGRKGGSFAEDICQGPQLNSLTSAFQKGLLHFCSPESAKELGLSGNKYQNNCPTHMEKSFLVEYKKGRLVWAQQTLENKTQEIKGIEKDLPFQEQVVSLATHEVNTLENMKTEMERRKGLAFANQSLQTQAMYDIEINRISGDLNNVRYRRDNENNKLNEMKSRKSQLATDISNLKTELAQLSAP